jgi:phage gp36-like protein
MYSTVDDIGKLIPQDILIQLTDDENTAAPVTPRIEEAIGQADAEINTYCATKYTVPFVTVPDAVKKCSVDIAIYNLYSRRVEEIPATRSDRYKNAIRLLEAIAKGTITLGVAPSAEPPGNTDESPVNTKTADDRTCTKESMGGF